ncbi:OmpA family protein [bacterium]|nr:OmpA family protein [bacterium]MCB1220647.1 OmpA family protein [bacterium]UNM09152.1 MAG: OmpA family protein [Planctomycetales bacterium]
MYRFRLTALLLVATILLSSGISQAKGATEHPVIKPFGGAEFVDGPSKTTSFDTFDFLVTTADGKKTDKVTKKGKYWYLRYRITDASGQLDKSVGAEEILENYRNACLQRGGTIHYDYSRRLVFSLTRDDGGETWVNLQASDGNYDITIVDEKGLDPTLVFGAEEMASEIDIDGDVVVYGINFAVDSDRLEPGSEKVLTEMVKLMRNEPQLRIEIQGHTDNTGSADYNLKLSDRRVATVREFLILFGIDPARMISKGYGLSRPVATNDTEEGRALNRRVELHRMN